uniref:Hypothetical secreted protein 2068 n=1 Tax=Amblyomma variegatum TaxID=34610 RepID=F0JA15_AMBVA|nr:TPA_inf: hypothetical secreted protein 2068 [Amblyomma variegatum]
MYVAALFLGATLAVAAQGLSLQSARTFGSSHVEPMVPASHHSIHHQSVVPGHVHSSHQASVGDHYSGSMLVCQVVQIPVIQPGAPSAGSADVAQVSVGTGPAVDVASSVISSSQQALSNLNNRVRNTVDRIVRPVVSALENASLWLNSTTQHQMNGHHQHGHHAYAHHHPLQQLPHGLHATPVQSAHSQNVQDVLPQKAVPMTVVSLPVLGPAVPVSSGSPVSNLSTSFADFTL